MLTWPCHAVFLFATSGRSSQFYPYTCSVSCHLKTGLLQLVPGKAATMHLPTLATDPEFRCKTCFQLWLPVAAFIRFITLVPIKPKIDDNTQLLTTIYPWLDPMSLKVQKKDMHQDSGSGTKVVEWASPGCPNTVCLKKKKKKTFFIILLMVFLIGDLDN